MAAAAKKSRDLDAEIAFLTRALKAPALRDSAERLAARAREESWTHEEYLVACLQREVAARDAHGGEGRIRAARFPARKSLEEFDFDHARGLKRDTVAHLGTLDFIAEKGNVVFLGPPGTGKTHLATGIAVRACQAGHRVPFATASQWTGRLAAAHAAGKLQAELTRLARYPLLVIDLCRHRNYAEGAPNIAGARPWRQAGPRHSPVSCRARLGPEIYPGVLVTGCRGTRGSCRWGGSGPAWR
jgi:DNA replication protein DnaC